MSTPTSSPPSPSKAQILDHAIELLKGTGMSPGMLKNIKQIGWVNKAHPGVFRELDGLVVSSVDGGVHHSQNREWRPVFVIEGLDD